MASFSTIPDGDMVTAKVASSFTFSGIRPDKLDATEYTLVDIECDKSGSVDSFKADLIEMLNAILGACKKSPRAENLLLRRADFNTTVDEFHGFVPLSSINPYEANDLRCGGMTALRDAIYSAVAGMKAYAKRLTDQDFSVNGVIYVITDGDDNSSSFGEKSIKDELSNVVADESIESLSVVLVGVNAAQYVTSLKALYTNAGLSQFVEVKDATPQRLAKLAGFVSKSISSTSQSLGSGAAAPSQSLTI